VGKGNSFRKLYTIIIKLQIGYKKNIFLSALLWSRDFIFGGLAVECKVARTLEEASFSCESEPCQKEFAYYHLSYEIFNQFVNSE
jgi:hypothetical protein